MREWMVLLFGNVILAITQEIKIVDFGHDVKLKCESNATSFIWKKGNTHLSPNKTVLDLISVKEENEGVYSCFDLSNDVELISYNVSLRPVDCTLTEDDGNVRQRPHIDSNGFKNTTKYVGENVTLNCYERNSETVHEFLWIKWISHYDEKKLINLTKDMTINQTLRNLNSSKFEVVVQEKLECDKKIVNHGNALRKHLVLRLKLINLDVQDAGRYTCITKNNLAVLYKTLYLDVKKKKGGTEATSSSDQITFQIVSIALGSLTLVFLLAMAWLFFKMHHRKKCKSSLEILMKSLIDKPEKFKRLRGFSNSTSSALSSLLKSEVVADCPSYDVCELQCDLEWEIDRSCLRMVDTLGEGAFGVVIKSEAFGLVRDGKEHKIVAIKMLKADSTENELLDLISEMDAMKRIGRHQNIINFLGCCSRTDPIWVVMEYAPHGNLKQYLRSKRPPQDDSDQPLITLKEVVSFALQIAKGMMHLVRRKCVHRDLAARNILVGHDFVIKIADFGLARNLVETHYYRKTTERHVPVKWLAVEALFERVYTTQSDVWAFGIVLWEIFTLGGSPYPGIPVERLFNLLKSGYRMDKPQLCPDEIYGIMTDCWNEDPNDRPSFSNLAEHLEEFLEAGANQVKFDVQLKCFYFTIHFVA